MSGRNRGPSHPIKGAPHTGLPPLLEPPFGRGLGQMPHPALLEEMMEAQFGRGGRPLPLHPAIIEERLGAQHQEIQGLLVDNQRLAATHVALKQELAAAQHELQRMAHIAGSMHAEKDMQLREVHERFMKMEADFRTAEAMKAELQRVRADIQKLTTARQELTSQAQALTQDLNRANSELQQAPALKAEIDGMKQELQRGRAAIEYEKKGYTENYEQGQAMEKNLIAMAREVEKLRAEIANAEKRARAAAAVGNPPGPGYGGSYGNPEVDYWSAGPGYGGNYGNSDTGYGENPNPTGYGMNPVQGGAQGGSQYGPGPGEWGSYEMQQAHGRR